MYVYVVDIYLCTYIKMLTNKHCIIIITTYIAYPYNSACKDEGSKGRSVPFVALENFKEYYIRSIICSTASCKGRIKEKEER